MYFLEIFFFTLDCFVTQVDNDAVYPPSTRQTLSPLIFSRGKCLGKSLQLLKALTRMLITQHMRLFGDRCDGEPGASWIRLGHVMLTKEKHKRRSHLQRR